MPLQSIVTFFILFTFTCTSLASNDNKNFQSIVPLAGLANAIYTDVNTIKAITQKYSYKLEEYKIISGAEVTYLLASDIQNKQHIIAIRGTANLDNAVVDMQIKLLPDKVTGQSLHQGFAEAATAILTDIKSKLNKNYSITTTGHSLGGAVALVLGMQLDTSGFNIKKVITFGQPKVTNIAGARKYKHLNITRFVRPKDIVPLVPPLDPLDINNLDIYWHVGQEILLMGNHRYAIIDGFKSMQRSLELLSVMPNEENMKNHTMAGYLALIKENSQRADKVEYQSTFNPFGLLGN